MGVLSVRDEQNTEIGEEEGGGHLPWVMEGNKLGAGVRDRRVGSPSVSDPAMPFASEPQLLHTPRN